MSATDEAKKLLEATEHDVGCKARRPCAACGVSAQARRTIRRLGFTPDTLRVAIGLAEAAEAGKKARLATGWQSTCNKQVHGDSHIKCGECFICLERKALAEWEKLLEKEAKL